MCQLGPLILAAAGEGRFEWMNARNTFVQTWVEFGLPA